MTHFDQGEVKATVHETVQCVNARGLGEPQTFLDDWLLKDALCGKGIKRRIHVAIEERLDMRIDLRDDEVVNIEQSLHCPGR
jgi:hypothetical protein